jgi:hypothetical protein
VSVMERLRFLLIKSIHAGMWHEMHHVLGQLFAAEAAGRIPVVHWGKNSLYGIPGCPNAFELYFMPVSGYGIHDLMKPGLSYFPKRWNSVNLTDDEWLGGVTCAGGSEMDSGAEGAAYNETGDTASSRTGSMASSGTDGAINGEAFDAMTLETIDALNCGADVLVSDTFKDISEIRRMAGKYPPPGISDRKLYGMMLKKHIRLRPELAREIDAFYEENMAGRVNIAVHIRGSDKAHEVEHLDALNEKYPREVDRLLAGNPGANVFLMTDCQDILERYRRIYGRSLVFTDCLRVRGTGSGVHFQFKDHNRQKGAEIIRDTYLAARCDYFIGNAHSNVSRAVSELRDWDEGRIMLLD